MSGRERIMAAIAGKQSDRVALWPFVMAFSAKYAQIPYSAFATDYKMLAKAQIATADYFGLDAVTVDSDAYREATAFGAVLDFPEDDLPVMVKHAITDQDKFDFMKPDIGASLRLVDKIEGVRFLSNHYQGEKAVVGWIEAPLQSAGMLYNMDDFMIDLLEGEEFILRLLDLVTEFEIEFALEQAWAGADIIGIGDAMASLVSANLYQEKIMPCLKRVVQAIHANSAAKVKYHMCGDSKHLLPYVTDIGFDIINIDYKINMAEAFKITNDEICIKGNINPVTILRPETETQIAAEVIKLLDLQKPNFILSAGCEIARDTPVKNFKAFCNAVGGMETLNRL